MPRPSIARTKSRAALTSATWSVMIRPPSRIVVAEGHGRRPSRPRRRRTGTAPACGGASPRTQAAKSSLKIILMASAKGWKSPKARRPKTEALLAPIRSCMTALSFRSTQVRRRARSIVQVRARTILTRRMSTSVMASIQLHLSSAANPARIAPSARRPREGLRRARNAA